MPKVTTVSYGAMCHKVVVDVCSSGSGSSTKAVPAANSKLRGPVNGDECYFWRTTGCQFTTGCRYRHVPENKGIDKKPWQKTVKWTECLARRLAAPLFYKRPWNIAQLYWGLGSLKALLCVCKVLQRCVGRLTYILIVEVICLNTFT